MTTEETRVAEHEPIPDLSHIPTGMVTWRRTPEERLVQEHAEQAKTPHSVTYIAEGWDLAPGVTRTRQELETLARALYGPPQDPRVLGIDSLGVS